MSSIGTFGSFTQARLGIYASQAGLSITGNNIANINTAGYTRQKLDQTSLYSGGSDRYYSPSSISVGSGVVCTGTSQMRDPYLDLRYRNEVASVGAMDTKLNNLSHIQRILDETGDGKDGFGLLGAQFSDLFKQLEILSDHTGLAEYDIQVRSSAESLAKLFNSYASKLEEAKENAVKELDVDLKSVNSILEGIQDLSVNIRKADLHGDPALELRDQRNVLIDELSRFMKIDVSYDKEKVTGGVEVERLTIKLGDANPDPTVHSDEITLIHGIYAARLHTPIGTLHEDDGTEAGAEVENPLLQIQVKPLTSPAGKVYKNPETQEVSQTVVLGDNDLFGSLQAHREFLTENGEFATEADMQIDPNASVKRGIGYYQKALDLLAKEFANTMNEANMNGWMTGKEPKKGGPLFSNRSDNNDTSGITAANISISKDWATGPQVANALSENAGSTDSSNILHMLVLMNEQREYKAEGSISPDIPLFKGSFNEMWNNIGTILGNDMMTTGTMLDTYQTSSVHLNTSRDSVSSVDLNDEAMNLMQYQKSYSAACRLMTTIDTVLEKLINGTGTTR